MHISLILFQCTVILKENHCTFLRNSVRKHKLLLFYTSRDCHNTYASGLISKHNILVSNMLSKYLYYTQCRFSDLFDHQSINKLQIFVVSDTIM